MFWNWSFRLGFILGVEVRIHWSLPAVFFFYAFRSHLYGASPGFLALFVLLPLLLLFASVLAHEFGHVQAARHYLLPVHHVILSAIGGLAYVGPGRSPRQELVVAAAGPAVNLVLWALALAAFLGLGGPPRREVFIPFLSDAKLFGELWLAGRIGLLLLHDFAQTQIFLFLFNVLLVAFPLDGGRMLFAFFWTRMGYHAALARSCRIARVLALPMGALALVTFNLILGLIALFVWIQASQTLRTALHMPDPSAGYDPRFDRAWREQQRAIPRRPGGPGFLARWLRSRRAKKVESLLLKVQTKGIGALSEREREILRRERERF
ncbi:MAG: hypothetical protein HY720_12945 [Planctomycetes bacterium]|nr:hypothetical protein [Planctomycetota bacterium]